MVSLLVAMAIVLVRPKWRRRPAGWVIAASAVVMFAVATGLVLVSPAMTRVQASLDRAEQIEASGISTEEHSLAVVTSSRWTLARAAIDMGMAHPILGGGRGSFKVELPRWALRRMAEDPGVAPFYEQLTEGTLTDAHNALLQAWAEGGIPSVVFLSYALVALGWRLWRQSASDRAAAAALALFSLVLVAVPVSIVTAKAPGAIIATCLAISWAVPSPPARRILQRRP
jgi:O-antigen ligase